MERQLRTTAVTVLALAIAGIVAGVLWYFLVPEVPYLIVRHEAVPVDPEEAALIAFDGIFALITIVAGVLSGAIGYLAGGRRNDIALLIGLAAGGLAAGLIAWLIGHLIDLSSFEQALRSAPDGRKVNAVPDLQAYGVLTLWPLLAVATYGLLEALQVGRHPEVSLAGDESLLGRGEPDQVGGGELDLQAAPSGGHIDGGEARG